MTATTTKRVPRKNSLRADVRGIALILLSVTALAAFSTAVYAQTWAELVGKLENSYRTSQTGELATNGNEYTQNYVLGVKGQLISSRLLSYYLGTRVEDRAQKEIRVRQLYWYDASGTLFRARPLSLNLHARRSTIEVVGTPTPQRFEDDLGAELFLYRQNLPKVRVGYRNINQTGMGASDVRTHITTVRVENSFRQSRVEGSFRDEQRILSGLHVMTRIQETQLRGTAEPWENTQFTSEGVYRRQDDNRNIRASVQVLGRYRERDRLNGQISLSRFIDPRQTTATSQVRLDHRYYLSPLLHVATTVNSQHTRSHQPSFDYNEGYDNIGSGLVFLKQRYDQKGRDRWSAEGYLSYASQPLYGGGPMFNHLLAREWQRSFSKVFSINHRLTQEGRLAKYQHLTYRNITHAYLFEATVMPMTSLAVVSRSRVSDKQGDDAYRLFEQRGEVIWTPQRRLSVVGNITFNAMTIPYFDQSIQWGNIFSLLLSRYFTVNGQTNWVVYRTSNRRTFWAESTLIYTMRKIEMQMTLRQESILGVDRTTVFFRAARIIGGGVASR